MESNQRGAPTVERHGLIVTLLVTAFAALRLCHVGLLWADEDYHLAAALNILHGKSPYLHFWYDKPPLNALFYLLVGAHAGWPLRLLDAVYVLLACWSAFQLARAWWGENEGRIAALLTAFFLTFYFPSAVISFAADALMIVPHFWAVYFAYTKRPLLAGVSCAIAFLFNIKALFTLAVCAAWIPGQSLWLLAGFFAPLLVSAAIASGLGMWPGYVAQVWQWGWVYAKQAPSAHPVLLGFSRTANWLGFHGALLFGAVVAFVRGPQGDRFKLGAWLALSFVAVCVGERFDPRYFLQLLPPLAIAAARGFVLAHEKFKSRAVLACSLLLAIPLVRFGPRYVMLVGDAVRGRATQWADAALDEDSRRVAGVISAQAQPGETVFVWGYRSDVYVYTRLTADGLFWDSQPLTGVPADRHLHASKSIYSGLAEQNRLLFVHSKPTFFVDGLGPLNPALRPEAYPEIRRWLENYRLIGITKLSLIYRRRENLSATSFSGG